MRTYDLLVLGAGSGNMLFTPEMDELDAAIVEPVKFGGTCLNRGCIPSKMFVKAADAARAATTAHRLGVHASVDRIDWPAIRDRIFGRIDPLPERSADHRRRTGTDVYTEPARFVAPRTVEVGDTTVAAERVVVAAGSRPNVPDIAGLDDVPYHTSDTIMRLDALPRSLLIVGGGFVAAEMGHVFDAFGTDVAIVHRGPQMLGAEDDEISARFTELADGRFTLHLDSSVTAVEHVPDGVRATVEGPTWSRTVDAEVLLIATGRRPNGDLLEVTEGGIEVDEHGHLVTDTTCHTTADGVWALGDVANHFQLKHMANAESRIVAHNLLHPDDPRHLGTQLAPHAVFSEPQVAGVGLTQAEAERDGVDHVVATRAYSNTAYGWALEDTTSFAKAIADPDSRLLLGAHIIGPEASILIQPMLQGMMLGQTVDQMAREVLYIHPALTEVVEQVLLEL